MKTKSTFTLKPDKDYRFFIQAHDGAMFYFDSPGERDAHAELLINAVVAEGYVEEVQRIVAGEVTHRAARSNVLARPAREHFNTDAQYYAAVDQFLDSVEHERNSSYALRSLVSQSPVVQHSKLTSINQIRRNNLKKWLAVRGIPAVEKSYFSQLINGKASFGEKAARRIELEYGLPINSLDSRTASDGLDSTPFDVFSE